MPQLTISNLTNHPITALVPLVSSQEQRRSAGAPKWLRQRACRETSELVLGPQLEEHLAALPRTRFNREEVTLRASSGGKDALLGAMCKSDFRISISIPPTAIWLCVSVPEDCPWRIYIMNVAPKHRRLVILERRNLTSFMAELPDRLPLSSLSLPGTHDTMAFYGWPLSQCQTVPLLNQLFEGIRVIDIRLAVDPPPLKFKGPGPPSLKTTTVTPELVAYHGFWPQQTPFFAILNDVYEFLTSPVGQSETIVMSIKQEDSELTPPGVFSPMVRDAIMFGPGGGWAGVKAAGAGAGSAVNHGMWFLENRIPTLGEVRGKVVLFSRFGGDGSGWQDGLEGIGIHPHGWPDSRKEGFEWDLKGTRVRTHDWYSIGSFLSIGEKAKLAALNLVPPTGLDQPMLPITFCSAVNVPLALPSIVAKGFGWPDWGLGFYGVNTLLGKWLLEEIGATNCLDRGRLKTSAAADRNRDLEKNDDDHGFAAEEPRIRGWTFLDYYSEPRDSQVVPLLVECNFLGRKNGEEGW